VENNVFFIVMLDEFQDIVRWGEPTLKRMRTVMQTQKRVCYVLSGSITSIMHNLVYDRRSPFYRQFVEIPVKKLEGDIIHEFLRRRFNVAEIQCTDDLIRKVATLSDRYPDYVQRIGMELYLMVGRGGTIEGYHISAAYENTILSLNGEFENYFTTFSPLDKEILIALAIGRIRASEIAREVRKSLPNISKNLTILKNYGIIERPLEGQYRITDPIFADWIRRRFSSSLTYRK
jgi:DNA-binding transcriptional ArsR family regulator